MKKTYCFEAGKFNPDDFQYTYSPICKEFATFTQEDACIVSKEGSALMGYAYISILEKTPRSGKVLAQTQCAFEKFGAPLIVFTDDLHYDEEDHPIYGKHFEVVAYEDGINIWHIVPNPQKTEFPIEPTLLATKKFSIEANSVIDLKVCVEGNYIKTWVNGEYLDVQVEDLPKGAFQIGITACEGINRFYGLTIED